MIPNAEPRTQTGSLGGEKIDMRFDEASLVHLMGLLTNLYSDQTLAVIREYSTNAWDAHVEAGVDQPIDVTLPSILDMTFKVRDYGHGLSPDDLKNIYALYGASTKRDSNEYNGMMGIGGKSALTYTNQFTIVSRWNGRKIGVSVSMSESGIPQMEFVFDVQTTDPSGVEIIIPARRDSLFESKAREFYRFWPKGRVLLNGTDPSSVDGMWINDHQCVVNGNRPDVLVMGNVSYPVKGNVGGNDYGRNYHVVSYVENGAVNFTPSREELMYTALTDTTVSRLRSEFARDLPAVLSEKIKGMTKAEAFEFSGRWPNHSLTYQGRKVPSKTRSIYHHHIHYYIGDIKTTASKERDLSPRALFGDNGMFITGFTPQSFTRRHKAKLNVWAEAQGVIGNVYIMSVAPDNDFLWWTDRPVVNWSVIAKTEIKLAPLSRKDSLEVRNIECGPTPSAAKTVDASTLTGGVVYYFHSDTRRSYQGMLRPRSLAQILPVGMNLVWIAPSQKDKFTKIIPGAVHVQEWLRAGYQKWKDSLSVADRQAVYLTQQISGAEFYGLDPDRVADPDMANLIRTRKNSKVINERIGKEHNVWSSRYSYAGLFLGSSDFRKDLENDPVTQALDSHMRECYPLVRAAAQEASYKYIELVYNDNQKENDE